VIWRLLALIAGLAFLPEAGWLVIGARDRAAKGSALSLWDVVVVTVALTLLLVLAGMLVGVFPRSIDGWLRAPGIPND